MIRVLFICTGNTCRSPLAEVFARDYCSDLTCESDLVFESAGLQVNGSHGASEGSLRVASQCGLNLDSHLSKPVGAELLQETTWVIGMTRSHAAIFRSRFHRWYDGRVGVLGAPGIDLNTLGSSPVCEDVDDPYDGSEDTYDAAGLQIRRMVLLWGSVFAELQ